MKTEICIVGGGLVGLAAALAFSHQGRSVKLIEAADISVSHPAELDARSIALSYSTMQIFRSLGLWQTLQAQSAPIARIHVSSAGHLGVTRLEAREMGLDAMGAVIEYHLLVQTLLDAVEQQSDIEILAPYRLQSLQSLPDKVILDCTRDSESVTVETALLVVADGAQSSVRKMLGIEADVTDYAQQALIANLKIDHAVDGCAYERFTAHGPMAFLPLPNQRYALVWTNSPERTEQLMQLNDEAFIQQLYPQFGHRLGFFQAVGRRACFDLKLTRSRELVSDRCVLIGNAANSLHPVAGQGFNLALRDIACLFDQLLDQDLQAAGVMQQLQEYAQLRSKDQYQAAQYGHGLVQLFSNDLPLLNHARAGALGLLDIIPALKQEVSWLGMGYGSGCSSLMRGVG